ncbi:MAG: hypothetical protein IKA76_04310 [Clostridia bacterium]|nr:hypothetical protein [Clostridia bacterium]
MNASPLRFLSFVDGDVLFENIDGVLENDRLKVELTVGASLACTVTVNGIPAEEVSLGTYRVMLFLKDYRTSVRAVCLETGEEKTAQLFWFRGGYHTYRVGVDDVIFCLKNIWEHQEEYHSLFDDPYLAMYRELYDRYGTRTHMHIYYETVDKSFNLSMFPDKYKEEFSANAHWLRFSFHARADLPDSPYKYADYEQVIEEGRMVEREILRFAGKEVMDRVTSEHFADSNRSATRAFRDLGFSVLDAYFLIDDQEEPSVSYYLSVDQTRHAQNRDFWVDTEEDIIFVKDDVILNSHTPEGIRACLDSYLTRDDRAFMYLLIHEQYFYPHWRRYLPDYKERLFAGVEWCEEHGYRSCWISDFAFEDSIKKKVEEKR